MLSEIEKKKIQDLKAEVGEGILKLNRVIDERNLLRKELEVLKEEKKAIEKEYNSRNNFVEGLLSHILAKPIRIVLPDGTVEHRWQPVSIITGSEHRYTPPGRF